MAIVVLRGAVHGQPIDAVTAEAMVAMLVFAGVGYVAGWIADYLVRDSLEQKFRSRMDWYRKGLVDAGMTPAVDSANDKASMAQRSASN
jgi:hypothetical protein